MGFQKYNTCFFVGCVKLHTQSLFLVTLRFILWSICIDTTLYFAHLWDGLIKKLHIHLFFYSIFKYFWHLSEIGLMCVFGRSWHRYRLILGEILYVFCSVILNLIDVYTYTIITYLPSRIAASCWIHPSNWSELYLCIFEVTRMNSLIMQLHF